MPARFARISSAPDVARALVAGCLVHLRQEGSGPPLLFLHDEAGPAWGAAQQHLAQRFAVTAPDLPGFGASETPTWFDTIHDLAYATLDLMDTLGLSGVHLVGCSLGAWVAAEAALRNGQRLASLTLCGALGLHLKGVAVGDPFLADEASLAALRFHAPERIAPLPLDEDARDRHRFAFARMAWAPRLHDPHLEKWLHRITVPTLVLHGTEDRLLPPAYAARWAERIPGAQMQLLPGCGHAADQEQPAAFAAAVTAFIAESAA